MDFAEQPTLDGPLPPHLRVDAYSKPLMITRRSFTATLTLAPFCIAEAEPEWIDLFDGTSLDGWRAAENAATWKVEDGLLVHDGPRSHIYYTGKVHNATFRNFEIEVEAMGAPRCNSGVYFHTTYLESGFPKKGFEVQIENTAPGQPGYGERKKTGSLYAVRNVYKPMVGDNEWFRMSTLVRGKNVQVRVNGTLVVDYTEPNPPYLPPGQGDRRLDQGTFALQGHDARAAVRFRKVRVRPLPDSTETPGPIPVADDTFRRLIDLATTNIPVVDYHAHLKTGLTLEQMLAKGRQNGIQYGVAVNGGKQQAMNSDDLAIQFVESMKGQPAYCAMQAEGREWTQIFSRRAVARFDYVFSDSMTWTDNHGKRMRLWMPDEVGAIPDQEAFMETLVERTVGILDHEPLDIYANPTFLPALIAADYDKLWTEERMRKVVDAAARNYVAIELNNRYKLPSERFVTMAKESGCKFSFGTNNTGADDLGRLEYGLKIVEACQLGERQFFVPEAQLVKAVERKPEALRS